MHKNLRRALYTALFLLVGSHAVADELRILARTGGSTGSATLTSIDTFVSINNKNLVAFSGADTEGSKTFVVTYDADDLPHTASVTFPASTIRLFTGAAINNEPTPVVATRDRVNGAPPFFFIRKWPSSGSQAYTIVGKSPDDFDSGLPFVDVNDSGVVAFPALVGGATQTALMAGPSGAPAMLALYNGTITVRPQISNTNEVVIRDNVGRIIIWPYPSGSPVSVAGTTDGFTSTGAYPGISADGKVVSFTGNRGSGPGVFVSVKRSGGRTLFRMAGEGLDLFNAFDDAQRIGVTSRTVGEKTAIQIVLVGTLNGKAGVYAVGATATESGGDVTLDRFPARGVALLGDAVGTTGTTITSVAIYDPINASGSIAFRGGLSDGSVAVIRTEGLRPVIFLPGAAGSTLVDTDTDTERWPGLFTLSHEPLSLFGTPSAAIRALDVVRYAGFIFPIYGPFLQRLTTGEGLVEYQLEDDADRLTFDGCDYDNQKAANPTLFVFPYDWRKGIAENATALKEYVRCVNLFHPGAPVNIVAHSMGGLVARRYILDNPTDNKVNALITVGSPWLGAPKTLYVMESGDFVKFVTDATIKDIVGSFAGIHQLLPSRAYFRLAGAGEAPLFDQVPLFEAEWDFDEDGVIRGIASYNEYLVALNRHFGRAAFLPGTATRNFHDFTAAQGKQDDWTGDSTGVSYFHLAGIYAINGEPQDSTIRQVVAKNAIPCFVSVTCSLLPILEPLYGRGDGTVPLLSATRMVDGVNGLNLNGPATVFPLVISEEHDKMTSDPEIQTKVVELLTNMGSLQRAGAAASSSPSEIPASSEAFYVTIVGGSSVVVRDSLGNSTAPIPGTLSGRGTVPGVDTYDLGHGVIQVVLSAGTDYFIEFVTGSDPMAVDVRKGTGDTTSRLLRYQNFTLPSGKKVRLTFSPAGVQDLRYDDDGNGSYETVVPPKVNASGSALETDPPVILVSRITQSGGIRVTLSVTDTGSGVRGTFFSLDGSQFSAYSAPVLVDPALHPIFYYFADDNLGNRGSGQVSLGPIGAAEPRSLLVDAAPDGGLSNGNGILEAGETAVVKPFWKNLGGSPLLLSGTASGFTGPAGAIYTLNDSLANYGSIAAGATNDCGTTTGNCYEVSVSNPATRPSAHWDASFTETLSDGDPPMVWQLHIGESFTDVPKNHTFYQFVERIFHKGVTTGCGGTAYCPDDTVFRLQMAIFIARAQAGSDANIPVSGSAQGNPYNCLSGGQSQFTDIDPTNPFCRHVHYLFKTGVTTGCITTPPRQYCPGDNVSRGQMALFIGRAVAGSDAAVPLTYGPDPVTGRSYSCNAGTPNLHFTDIATSDIYCRHTHYLWAKDVISGFPDGSFGPALPVTRGAMSKFLANGFNLQLYKP